MSLKDDFRPFLELPFVFVVIWVVIFFGVGAWFIHEAVK